MKFALPSMKAKIHANCPDSPDWEALADGMVHRLKYGKHFKGTIRAQVDGARRAAQAMDKAVRTQADSFEQFGYLWVQFADFSVRVGRPCRCGGTLSRIHPRHARCTRCGATVLITGDLGMDLAAKDAVTQGGGAVAPSLEGGEKPRVELRPKPSQPNPERLDFYSDVQLFQYRRHAESEIYAGIGTDPRGAGFLLVVSYALVGGERVPHPREPKLEQHKVSRLPLHPFRDVIDIDALRF